MARAVTDIPVLKKANNSDPVEDSKSLKPDNDWHTSADLYKGMAKRSPEHRKVRFRIATRSGDLDPHTVEFSFESFGPLRKPNGNICHKYDGVYPFEEKIGPGEALGTPGKRWWPAGDGKSRELTASLDAFPDPAKCNCSYHETKPQVYVRTKNTGGTGNLVDPHVRFHDDEA